MFQQDLKGLLAYSTISHLGLITLLLGLGSPLAAVAAIFHMLNHATFKASLFMAAGIIDHEAGTRDMRRLSGLFRYMPITATLVMVASCGHGGRAAAERFPFQGDVLCRSGGDPRRLAGWITRCPIAALAERLRVTYSLRFIHASFSARRRKTSRASRTNRRFWMRFPGQVPGPRVPRRRHCSRPDLGPSCMCGARRCSAPRHPEYSLAVWHGFTVPLLMSVIALAGGVLLYLAVQATTLSGIEGPPLLGRIKGQRIFERVSVAISWRWARSLEDLFGTSRLQPQMRLLVAPRSLRAPGRSLARACARATAAARRRSRIRRALVRRDGLRGRRPPTRPSTTASLLSSCWAEQGWSPA